MINIDFHLHLGYRWNSDIFVVLKKMVWVVSLHFKSFPSMLHCCLSRRQTSTCNMCDLLLALWCPSAGPVLLHSTLTSWSGDFYYRWPVDGRDQINLEAQTAVDVRWTAGLRTRCIAGKPFGRRCVHMCVCCARMSPPLGGVAPPIQLLKVVPCGRRVNMFCARGQRGHGTPPPPSPPPAQYQLLPVLSKTTKTPGSTVQFLPVWVMVLFYFLLAVEIVTVTLVTSCRVFFSIVLFLFWKGYHAGQRMIKLLRGIFKMACMLPDNKLSQFYLFIFLFF